VILYKLYKTIIIIDRLLLQYDWFFNQAFHF